MDQQLKEMNLEERIKYLIQREINNDSIYSRKKVTKIINEMHEKEINYVINGLITYYENNNK